MAFPAELHRGQRTRVGSLCRVVSGSRSGPGRRTGSAHGRRAYLERCREVTEQVLRVVFNQLYTQRVMLEGMILKPNMVLPGLTCAQHEDVEEVAIGEQQYQVD